MTNSEITTDHQAYAGLEPREVWRHFAALNAIPRPSGQEQAALDYVRRLAAETNATTLGDARGNLVVRIPATAGSADAPTIAIQGHLDMVCEKRPGIAHDFAVDPIRPRRDGDRIYATGTTLGADNGVGAALALALLTTPELKHGPLELLFTVEEETGIHGAMELDPALVTASMLINLDSEDPLHITIGCAGGADTILHLPVETEPTPEDWVAREIIVSGLKGGHSGVQIHERLLNAFKVLSGALGAVRNSGAHLEMRLIEVSGGTAHNAIPRDAFARLVLPPDDVEELEQIVEQTEGSYQGQWSADEPHLTIQVREVEAPARVLTTQSTDAVLDLLNDLPHGVLAMSHTFEDKVETSSNLAQVMTREGEIEIGTSTRSFRTEELKKTQDFIRALGERVGAKVNARDGYPGWEPDAGSHLLHVAKEVYEQAYHRAPIVEVVHAGLECGIIVSKRPGLEAISFGPLIRGAHTPEEYVDAPTVVGTWQFLTALLEQFTAETQRRRENF